MRPIDGDALSEGIYNAKCTDCLDECAACPWWDALNLIKKAKTIKDAGKSYADGLADMRDALITIYSQMTREETEAAFGRCASRDILMFNSADRIMEAVDEWRMRASEREKKAREKRIKAFVSQFGANEISRALRGMNGKEKAAHEDED